MGAPAKGALQAPASRCCGVSVRCRRSGDRRGTGYTSRVPAGCMGRAGPPPKAQRADGATSDGAAHQGPCAPGPRLAAYTHRETAVPPAATL